MARPRVFVSSTYYDLKHLRSSLENFVESLGFDAILSEKGKIAYAPDVPLDESCYREVGTADIFVLIIGGRYGSEASSGKTSVPKTFFDRYNSITRGEYRAAVDRDTPMYILIERSVYAEYETFLKNKLNKKIVYAHVDSVNIFELIEELLTQPRNNPIQQFDRYAEIESWLREQWAGLFRELLQRVQGQTQIASLQNQVAQLSELNTTFKRYLEAIVSRIAPAQESRTLISSETKRLKAALRDREIMDNPLVRYLVREQLTPEAVREALEKSTSLETFLDSLLMYVSPESTLRKTIPSLGRPGTREHAIRDINRMRVTLGLPTIEADSVAAESESHATKGKRPRKRSSGRGKRPNKALEPTAPTKER